MGSRSDIGRCRSGRPGYGPGRNPVMRLIVAVLALVLAGMCPARADLRYYDLPQGTGPHDVAPAPDGSVWYTGQRKGVLGRLDPLSGKVTEVALPRGSAPHGVIFGPEGALWVTDGGLNAIVRVDPNSLAVTTYPLPKGTPAGDLNTATFDADGTLWFTGQSGLYGSLDRRTGAVAVFPAPRGRGPYGITSTPKGEVWFASLAGNYIARIDTDSGRAAVVDPPTLEQGARRIWSDSRGRLWISEWNVGQVSRYDPLDGSWRSWRLPGERPKPYAVYVDGRDRVWLTDFAANAIVGFDPGERRL